MTMETRRPSTPEEEREIRFWVEALLKGINPKRAAEHIYSIGVRTRGAVRTRGSASTPARSRFPTGTPFSEILVMLSREEPGLRAAVAAALGEWGGGDEALNALAILVAGDKRDPDPAVRAAALDAIAVIGGPKSISLLEQVKDARDEDPVVKNLAISLLGTIK